jgi:hypothetical protein
VPDELDNAALEQRLFNGNVLISAET